MSVSFTPDVCLRYADQQAKRIEELSAKLDALRKSMNKNLWYVKTSRGRKLIDINPAKHNVIMGVLHDRATMKPIGRVTRQPTPEEIEKL